MRFLLRGMRLAAMLAIVAAIWFVGPDIAIGDVHPLRPAWARLLAIAILLIWAFRQSLGMTAHAIGAWSADMLGRRRAKTRPRSETAFVTLLQEAARTEATMRRSRYGRWRPWRGRTRRVLLLGPDSGIVRASLDHSGLAFVAPSLEARELGIRVHVSRTTRWIEYAPSSTTPDDWRSLSAMLRRGRHRLDAIALILPIAILDHADDREWASELRSRLDSLASPLGGTVPVWVLCHGDRAAPVGVPLPHDIASDAMGLRFPADIARPTRQDLRAAIEQWAEVRYEDALDRWAEPDRPAEVERRWFAWLSRVARWGEALPSLLLHLTSGSGRAGHLRLRGCYFAAGGIAQQAPTFLSGFFAIVSRSTREGPRPRWLDRRAGVAIMAAAAILLPVSTSLFCLDLVAKNRSALSVVGGVLQLQRKAFAAPIPSSQALLTADISLTTFADTLRGDLGRLAVAPFLDAAAKARSRLYSVRVVPRLADLAQQSARTANTGELIDLLQTYLMLYDRDRRDSDRLDRWYEGHAAGDTALPTLLHNLDDVAIEGTPDARFVDAVRHRLSDQTPVDFAWRAMIATPPLENRQNFTLESALGDSAWWFRHSDTQPASIPWLLTAEGLREQFLPTHEAVLRRTVDEFGWTMGASALREEEIGQLARMLRLRYVREALQAWDPWLTGIGFRDVHDRAGIARLAMAMSAEDSGLTRLLSALSTTLPVAGPPIRSRWDTLWHGLYRLGLRDDPVAKVLPEDPGLLMRAHYRSLMAFFPKDQPPAGLLLLRSDLRDFSDSLVALSEREGSGAAAGGPSLRRFALHFAALPDPLRNMLLPLAGRADRYVAADTELDRLATVRSDLSDPCRTAIAGRYPFDPESAIDADPQAVSRLLMPGGQFDTVFNATFASVTDRARHPWSLKSGAGGRSAIPLLAGFETAHRLQTSLFDPQMRLRLQFALRPVAMSSNLMRFVLRMDGQSLEYAHGLPATTRMSWPSPTDNADERLTMTVVDADGQTDASSFEGPWAPIRWMEAAEITRDGPSGRLHARFHFRAGTVDLDVIVPGDNPLRTALYRSLSCPSPDRIADGHHSGMVL